MSIIFFFHLLFIRIANTYASTKHNCTWPVEVNKHNRRITSQGGQDGALAFIFKQIGITNHFFVEFGFNTPSYEQSIANTNQLYQNGWKGLLMDGDNKSPPINLQKEFITPENIVSLLTKYQVPLDVDYLSIDIDSSDLFVFEAVLQSNYKPRVISMEYNCQFTFESSISVASGVSWKGI